MGFTGGGSSGAIVTVPIGAVICFGGDDAPSGYVLCDGTAISRTTFANLFAVIGTNYGVGDGSTTFNVPDMKTDNAVARGTVSNATLGNTGGVKEVTLSGQESGIQAHSHAKSEFGGTQNGIGGANLANIQGPTNQTGITGDTNAVEAHDNEAPFVDFNWVIKA